ncbi:Flavin reductase-like FMN-binding protein [Botryosphaeria dothidea]|uniref:Flavin reductase-like FMN-binding protein n=1 Tax=Botryosphaeria dothidea TaxID=55169 RepID=A0A8H4IR35_9PEZI|nr:Flavin reductase-like FMN-binding protein [Botryosphaeria dothidea]
MERRFYQAFFRWNNALRLSKHPVHHRRRLLSSSSTRKAEDDKPSASDQNDILVREKDLPLSHYRSRLDPETTEVPTSDRVHPPERKEEFGEGERGPLRLPEVVRNVFRFVPHPVAIVTALAKGEDAGSKGASFGGASLTNEYEEALDQLRAMTVSSLNTISLDPEPIVSFNIRTPSSTWDAIQATPRFRIFLLRPTERARELALSFARGETRQGFFETLRRGMRIHLSRPGGVFKLYMDTTEWHVEEGNFDPNPAPLLKSKGIACCLSCTLLPEKCVQVNDHVIVVASVDRVFHGTDRFWSPPRSPTLSYFNHEFVCVDRPVTAQHSGDEQSMGMIFRKVGIRSENGKVRKDRKEGERKVEETTGDQDNDGVRSVIRSVKPVKPKALIRKIEC